MERDPALFAWRAAPAHHAAAVGLSVGLGGPLAALALFCLRDLVDALTQDGTGKLAFLKLVLPLPEGFAERRLTLFDGVLLSPSDLQLAALGGIAGTAIAVAGLGWFVSLLCFEAQTRATLRLRAKAAEAILRSPAAAREDVRALPDLVGRALAAMGGIAAVGILLPAMSLAGLALALVLGELAAPRLVPVVLAALLAAGLARILVLRRASAIMRS